MRTIFIIVVKEFHQLIRDKRQRTMLILGPVLQLLLLGYAATTDIKNIALAVCDQDKSETSRTFVRSFVSSGYFTVVRSIDDYKGVDGIIDRGDAQVALIIPPKFGADMAAQVSAPVQLIVDGSDGYTGGIALGYASQIAGAYNQKVLQQTMQRSGAHPNIGSINTDLRVWYNPELASKNYMIPGTIAMILLITVGILTAMAIVKEREYGTLEQIIVTPIKSWQLILGKLIPATTVGMIDVVIIIVFGTLWFNVPVRGDLLFLFFCGGIYLMSALGIGLFVSTIAHSQQQASLSMQFFIMIPFIYLSGFTFSIETMPKALQYVTYLIPLRYFLEIVRGIFLKGDGFLDLWPSILGMFIIGAGMLTLSITRFHKRLD